MISCIRSITLAVALVMIAIFATTAGCGKKTDDDANGIEIKVAFWGSPEEIKIINSVVEEWQPKHPDIHIRLEHTPYGGYVSKILTRIAGGAAPDVICAEVDYFVNFATKGVFENLTPYIKEDNSFNVDDFFPEVIRRFTVGGHVYAIPRDTAPFACVFYNKELFDKAGVAYPADDWTWDDLLEKAKALTKSNEDGRITQYGFYGWAWQNFVYGNGGALVDKVQYPKSTKLDDPKSIEGLQFYSDLIHVHKVMPAPVALANSGMGVDLLFASGRLAMFLSGIWETPALKKHNFAFDVAMFPKNKEGIRRFGTGGSGYGILKSSEHKQEAWEVVKALTGAVAAARMAEQGLAQPARIAVSEGEAFAKNDSPPANKDMLNEAVAYVEYSPFHLKWREIEAKYIRPELDLVFNGKKTVQEAIDEMTPKINEALANTE